MGRHGVLIALVALLAAGSVWADDLYSTDFEDFSLGGIDGQQDWQAIVDAEGQIVNSGDSHGKVLQVMAEGPGWGQEVRRNYDAESTKQYLTVEMDFMRKDAITAFMFMDNNGPDAIPETPEQGGPESIFWDYGMEIADVLDVSSNASPGIGYQHYDLDEWRHVGIEVDQQAKKILRFNFDGTWYDETDTPDEVKWMSRFVFRSYSYESGGERLWIDNLSITDSDGSVPGDVDGNGVVDGLDLTAVLTAWETEPGDPLWDPDADLDDNDIVDGLDLTEVISNWTVASSAASSAAPDESEEAKPGKRLGNVRKGR